MRFVLTFTLLVVVVAVPLARAQPVPSDVAGHWAESSIVALLRRNLIELFSDQTFRPNVEIGRGEFIKWIVTAAGLPRRPARTPSFADVPASHPLAPYIETAVAYRLISRAPAFLPALPIRRSDAIAVVVAVMGDTFDAAAMSDRPLPYDDVAVLPPSFRGAVAVATYTQPPLLHEPAATSLRPLAAMTRGEAAALIWGYLQAIEGNAVLRDSALLAAGIDLITEKRGLLRTAPVLRIQIGAFLQEDNAQRLAAAMRDRGLPVTVDLEDGFYKVRVGNFTSPAEADLVRDQLVAEGYPALLLATVPNFDILPGPVWMAMIVVDPAAGESLRPAAGDGLRMVRQKTSDIARRAGALAAINGDFFASGGDPLGCLMIAGTVVSEPRPERTCAGITDDRALLLDLVRFAGAASTADATIPINGVNRPRGTDELILYQPAFDAGTRTNPFGAEAAVVGGVVVSIADGQGNLAIPRDGVVLSGHGRARQWIVQRLAVGTVVTVEARLVSSSGDARWDRVISAIGGGPRLLAGGQVAGSEGFPRSFTDHRHPRTALGMFPDGRVALFVVDGRNPYHSVGMTLLELAMELRRRGVVDALNLDGGGSTTMVVHGRVINLPSDETGERPVGSVLLVLPAPP